MSNVVAFFGLIFALFLPGFFITLIFFKDVKLLERILLSIAFSIMITISIGIYLGYDAQTAARTGGINPQNVWLVELWVTGLLALITVVIVAVWRRKEFLVFYQQIKKIIFKSQKSLKEKPEYRKL